MQQMQAVLGGQHSGSLTSRPNGEDAPWLWGSCLGTAGAWEREAGLSATLDAVTISWLGKGIAWPSQVVQQCSTGKNRK